MATTELGNIKLEIFDAGTLDGFPNSSLFISRAYCLGTHLSNNNTLLNFEIEQQNPNEVYSTPILVRGLGPSLNASQKILNPYITTNFGGITGFNDDWTGSQSGIIQQTNYAPTSGLESAYFGHSASLSNSVYINDYSGIFGKSVLDIIAISGNATGSIFDEYQNIISGQNSAFVSYDLSSGANSKRVFSYAISILDKVSGLQGVILNEMIYPGISISYSGTPYNAFCTNVDLFLGGSGYCKSPEPPQDLDGDGEPDHIEICLPDGLTSGALQDEINKYIRILKEAGENAGEGIPSEQPEFLAETFSSPYTVYDGYIYYQLPYSGDKITFSSYNFDQGYTGEYQSIYNVNPPYPQIDLTWTYPQDFDSASGLTTLINNQLSGSGYYLWHRFTGEDFSATGYYEFGPLLKATYLNTGLIRIESTRLNSAGNYSINVISGVRPSQKEPLNISKYMLPNSIILQGANTYGSWSDLDTRTDILWNSIKPINSIVPFVNITGVSGRATRPDAQENVYTASGAPAKGKVFEALILGTDKCNKNFVSRVDFFTVPTGVAGSAPCLELDEGGATDLDDLITGSNRTETGANFGNLYFLRTGFNFNNTGEFNYYRFLLSDFRASSRTLNQSLTNEFYVSSLSLFGYESGLIQQSGRISIIGANYTGQIRGLTTGIITGTASGYADYSTSGTVVFDLAQFTGIPNGNGYVRFQNTSGFYTTPFTGLLDITLSGTGFYTQNVLGYYYESGITGVSFSKPVSGYITGSGNLIGGPYNVITNISSLTGTQHVTGVTTGIASGIIPDFTYFFENIPAFSYQSGVITGNATSGYLTVNSGISFTPSFAYQFDITGTRQATGVLSYGAPNNGDYISINNIPVIYTTGTDNLPPTYYASISELTSIINSGSGQFLVTGSNDGSKIYLASVLLGVSGNDIPLISSGAPIFDYPVTTGGATYYRPITPTGLFTGLLSESKAAIQYFVTGGSGNITGQIKQLDFIRYFTGIWNLGTGDTNFRTNNWNTYNKYSNEGLITPFLFNFTPDDISVSVSYDNNPVVISSDMALLTITGYNFGTGIQIRLSGKL